MSMPDPKTVREIARQHMLDGAGSKRNLDDRVYARVERDPAAWLEAVAAEMDRATVTVSWPDEQPAAEQDGDVRAVRALTNATGRMLSKWAEANEAVRREMWTEVHDRADVVDDRFRERFAELDAAQAALDARDADGSAS